MPVMMADSRRDLEIHRYPAPLYLLVIAAALVLQALLPRAVGQNHIWFDFPLVVTIYFALGRRSPIQGMLIGSFVGIFEDALTHHALGINGIAKTIAGYLAASVGIRIDVQNYLVRLMLNFALTLLCSAIYLFIYRVLLGMELEWNWFNPLFQAIGNSIIALILFPLLDRFQVRD
ncbi:MAG TPA: rod shape-determining protein MreD [Terracidiphilus sp.]|jgi:rod shape-determining protein MreD|nr:rod shape-determining protein MreD [Terracidiphilus sp.]